MINKSRNLAVEKRLVFEKQLVAEKNRIYLKEKKQSLFPYLASSGGVTFAEVFEYVKKTNMKTLSAPIEAAFIKNSTQMKRQQF